MGSPKWNETHLKKISSLPNPPEWFLTVNQKINIQNLELYMIYNVQDVITETAETADLLFMNTIPLKYISIMR